MKKNVGYTDKIIRLIIAFILLLLVWFNVIPGKTWQIVTLVLALIAFATSYFEYCPIYAIFKINTLNESEKVEEGE